MMIHEKMVSGQFLLDLKNERANLLGSHHAQHQHNLNERLHPQLHQHHAALATHYLHLNQQHHNHHHHQQQQQLAQQALKQHQPPSPPLDIYAAYAYQQQQQLINNASKFNNNNSNNNNTETINDSKSEVLDLSRRCDSVETPRKTPSPTQTSSSVGTASPIFSPHQQQSHQTQQPIIPTNLLYSTQAQQQQQHQLPIPAPLPPALATLYPALYYSNNVIKLEPTSPNESPNKTSPLSTIQKDSNATPSNPPISNATDLLHTFATATAAAAKSPSLNLTSTETSSLTNSPSTRPHLNMLNTLEEKSTRPFKAWPRDPLVIAASFTANDVISGNAERYELFRKRMLECMQNSNGGSRTVTNPKMRRTNSRTCRSSDEERQDDQRSSKSSNNNGADESSDCDSNAGSFTDKTSTQNNNNSGIVRDAAYLERRKKNNLAAKKSRDRRRIKEDELAMRAEFLARENVEMACQIKALKAQLAAYTSKVGA